MKKFFVRFKYHESLSTSIILTLTTDVVQDMTIWTLKNAIFRHRDFKPHEGIVVGVEDIDIIIMSSLN